MTMTLEILDLDVTYGGTRAVRGASLRVGEGELVAILGPSGSGKTSLLHAVAGLVEPAAGRVILDGVDVTRLGAERRGIPIVFQGGQLFAHMRAWENAAFGLRMAGVPAKERRRRAIDGLRAVDVGELAERYPGELSGGQAQRVALARALVLEPRFAFFDEPFSHLDPELRERMRELVARLRRELGFGGLFVTHDHQEAFQLADRIAIMLDGRIAQVGSPREVYERPATEAVARFLGARNILAARVHRGKLEFPPFGEIPVSTPDGDVCVIVRAETLVLHPVSSRAGAVARVARVVERGETVRYELDVDGVFLETLALGPAAWGVGESVRVELTEAPWVLPADDASRVEGPVEPREAPFLAERRPFPHR